MPYNVFLFDGTIAARADSGSRLSSDQRDAIQKQLQGFFNQVVLRHDALAGPKGAKLSGAFVRWVTGPAPVANTELLVYFLPTGFSVARSGRLETGAPPPDETGLTHLLGNATASEVYLHLSDTDVLSKVAFHETMHNKLALDDKNLHKMGGLAAASVGPESTLTAQNIDAMARGLDHNRPQWTAGIQMLISESQRSDNDPLKGMGL